MDEKMTTNVETEVAEPTTEWTMKEGDPILVIDSYSRVKTVTILGSGIAIGVLITRVYQMTMDYIRARKARKRAAEMTTEEASDFVETEEEN